ncbi:MAG: outer membrane beta-barrel protein [Candidatus Kapaibacteriota bacterium]
MIVRKLFFCLIFIVTSISVYSQSSVIRGIVIDSSSKSPIPGVRAALIKDGESKPIAGGVSERSGIFLIKNVSAGTYILSVQSIGYAKYAKSITIPAGKDTVKIGTIRLGESGYLTDEVEVTAVATRIEMKGDTTEFSADAFKTDKNASAEDLVRKLPGMEVDASGSVKAQGEQVRRVLVDGKPFFGSDPAAALKNLPAEVIDKVQSFDAMSDQAAFTRFDDGDRTKTLNIVMKVDKKNGQFGKLYAGYGDQDRYTGGGTINIFNKDSRISIIGMSNNINQQNFSIQDILGVMGSSGNPMMQRMGSMMRAFGGNMGGMSGRGSRWMTGGGVSDFMVGQSDGITQSHGLGMNYTDSWAKGLSVTSSFFVNYSDNSSLQDVKRLYFLDDTSTQNNFQTNNNSSLTGNHRFNVRMDWTIDSMNSISIEPRLTLQSTEKSIRSINSTFGENSIPINASNTSTDTENTGYNGSIDMSYRHRFETEGRTISASARVSANNNIGSGRNNAVNDFYRSITQSFSDTLRQDMPSEGDGYNASTNIAFTENLHKGGQMQLSYNYAFNENTNDKKIYDFNVNTGEYSSLNQRLSNNALSTYATQRPGITYKYNLSQAANISIGVDYQIAKLNVEQTFPNAFNTSRTFYNLLPNISYQMRDGFTSNARLSYRVSTQQPSLSQLQDVIDNTDPIRLSTGNSNLVQEINNEIRGNYGTFSIMSGRAFFTMASLTLIDDKLSTESIIATSDTILPGNIRLGNGAQLTRPINISGAFNASSFITYTFPFEPFTGFKINVNSNLGGFFSRTPTLINGLRNDADNLAITPSLALVSNISSDLDFSVSWRTAYTIVQNSIRKELDNNYAIHTLFARVNWIFLGGFVFSGDFNYTINNGLQGDLNRSIPLLSLGIGKRFFDDNAEVKLSVYDALNQNQSINRAVQANYIEDSQTNVLQRYFLLNFTYNLRAFGTPPATPPGGGMFKMGN